MVRAIEQLSAWLERTPCESRQQSRMTLLRPRRAVDGCRRRLKGRFAVGNRRNRDFLPAGPGSLCPRQPESDCSLIWILAISRSRLTSRCWLRCANSSSDHANAERVLDGHGVLPRSLPLPCCRPSAIGFAFDLHAAAGGFAVYPTCERGDGGCCCTFAVGWPFCAEAELDIAVAPRSGSGVILT
jgi:hypothetical protein